MADFELQIDSRAFANRGIALDFDENRYGTLLEELAENSLADEAPIVSIDVAPIWGMSQFRKGVADLGRDHTIYPEGKYTPPTKKLDLKIDDDKEAANRLLLRTTRQWAGDLNGELAASKEADHQRRFVQRGITCSPVVAGAVAGFEVGGDSGVIVGGFAGLVVGAVAGVIDARRRPYHQAVKRFVQDPEVLAEYGQIISYRAL